MPKAMRMTTVGQSAGAFCRTTSHPVARPFISTHRSRRVLGFATSEEKTSTKTEEKTEPVISAGATETAGETAPATPPAATPPPPAAAVESSKPKIEAKKTPVARKPTLSANPFRQLERTNNIGALKGIGVTAPMSVSVSNPAAPMEGWDPLGLCVNKSESTVKRYREAELVHGRVCMLASLGILVNENGDFINKALKGGIEGPAIYQFQQVEGPLWSIVLVVIGVAEATRAAIGWEPPVDGNVLFKLRDTYDPGSLGWDPLKLRPKEGQELTAMRNKELNNGRLAMFGTAGMVVQELIDGQNVLPLHGGMLG